MDLDNNTRLPNLQYSEEHERAHERFKFILQALRKCREVISLLISSLHCLPSVRPPSKQSTDGRVIGGKCVWAFSIASESGAFGVPLK